jgi:histidine ammonia-lyase
MVSAQALEYRRPMRSAERIEAILAKYRQIVPRLGNDRVISTDIENTIQFWRDNAHFVN